MYFDPSSTSFSNLKGVYFEIETLQISPIHCIISKTIEFPGMVGETCTSVALFLMNCNDMSISPLEYEEARKMYRFTTGRSLRKAFWKLLKWHSPTAAEDRYRAMTAEAISRVI